MVVTEWWEVLAGAKRGFLFANFALKFRPVIPDTVLCRVVGLQFGLQAFPQFNVHVRWKATSRHELIFARIRRSACDNLITLGGEIELLSELSLEITGLRSECRRDLGGIALHQI